MNKITTYPKMNAEIADILRLGGGNYELYAAQLIEELQAEIETLKSWLEYEKDGRMKYQEELSKIPYCVEACKRCNCLNENAELKANLEKSLPVTIGCDEGKNGDENCCALAYKYKNTIYVIDTFFGENAKAEAEKALKEKGDGR